MSIGFGDWWCKRVLPMICWFPLVEEAPIVESFSCWCPEANGNETEQRAATAYIHSKAEGWRSGSIIGKSACHSKKWRTLRNSENNKGEPNANGAEPSRPFLGVSYDLPGTQALPLLTPFMVWCFLSCCVGFFLAFMGEKRNQMSPKASWPYYGSRKKSSQIINMST